MAAAAGFTQRQSAFKVAGELMRDRAIGRGRAACSACGRIKNGSWPLEEPPEPEALHPSAPAPDLARPWYWEGNVQACVVSELRARGYRIESAVDTTLKEPGTDS